MSKKDRTVVDALKTKLQEAEEADARLAERCLMMAQRDLEDARAGEKEAHRLLQREQDGDVVRVVTFP